MKPSDIHVLRQDHHMWPEPANTFLLSDEDGAIIIDAGCGWPERYRRLVEFLASHGFAPADVHTVVLSHAHPDHMGAMPFLLEEASPTIFIHPLELELAADPRLLNQSFDMCYITDYYLERLGDADPASFDILDYFSSLCPMGSARATRTIGEGDVLSLAGRDFEVVHTPGHAPGHLAFYERATRRLLSGDLVGAVVAWYCPSGGGATGYLESLSKLERLDIDVILPSHGDDITDVREAIDRTRGVLLARESRITEMLAEGEKSLLELTDALFPESTRMFPGLQITDSHLLRLEEQGAIERREREGMPFFIKA
jgi:glyoxylase-like metal-dependent hydrolase (beta-lactamase superfamily II)